jgi:hypothetical protein
VSGDSFVASDGDLLFDESVSTLQAAQERGQRQLALLDGGKAQDCGSLLDLGWELLELERQASSLTSRMIERNAYLSQIAAAAGLETIFREAWERVAARIGNRLRLRGVGPAELRSSH